MASSNMKSNELPRLCNSKPRRVRMFVKAGTFFLLSLAFLKSAKTNFYTKSPLALGDCAQKYYILPNNRYLH